MEFQFKSSECNGGGLVKSFEKDFEISLMVEEEYSNFKEGVSGTVKEVHLNHVYVIIQNYTNKNAENYNLHITQNQPSFLLQFVIDGKISLSVNHDLSVNFALNKNTYNLFYIPASKYAFKYFDSRKRVLNIYFTETFLKDKMGHNYVHELTPYQLAKNNNQFCKLFDKNLILNRQLKSIVNEFLNCSLDGTVRQSYMESKVTELVLVALTSRDTNLVFDDLREEERKAMRTVEDYIQKNLKSELNIENLSVLAGFSTTKFKTIFKQVYGMPVFQYITSLRIERAKYLITREDYTIAQASSEVGYKNPQHFTVAFKKSLGYLPSELIK